MSPPLWVLSTDREEIIINRCTDIFQDLTTYVKSKKRFDLPYSFSFALCYCGLVIWWSGDLPRDLAPDLAICARILRSDLIFWSDLLIWTRTCLWSGDLGPLWIAEKHCHRCCHWEKEKSVFELKSRREYTTVPQIGRSPESDVQPWSKKINVFIIAVGVATCVVSWWLHF